MRDPISNEIGKTIFFCVSIEHACKITQILNVLAEKYYPSKYNSDFAIQITSDVVEAQSKTISFANNNLNGHTNFLDDYDSSKARVAVTVGMMTTGYDCRDLLNICFCRPIFSPSDFIQMKGRGTRIFDFKYEDRIIKKENFKLFDFFGVCEYFENDFNYDEKLDIVEKGDYEKTGNEYTKSQIDKVIINSLDEIESINETVIDETGMKIDRKFYSNFDEKVKNDSNVKKLIENKDITGLMQYLQTHIFDKPLEFFTIRKLEQALGLERHLTIQEIARNIMNGSDNYKNREELLNDEFENFILLNKDEINDNPESLEALKDIFIAYLVDNDIREAIRLKQYQKLINSQLYSDIRLTKDQKIRGMNILEYIPYYVTSNSVNYEQYCA